MPPAAASPFGACRHHLPPRESVSHDSQVAVSPLRIVFACHPAKAVGLWTLNIVLHDTDGKRRVDFPLRGQVPRSGDRGAFPTGAAWFACFPYRALVRLYGFIIRGALYDLKGACHLPRSGEKKRKLTPLSSVAYGATPFLGKGALYCGVSRHHNPWAQRAHQT